MGAMGVDPCRLGGNMRGEIYHGSIKWKDLESLSEERRWELSGKTIQSWSRPICEEQKDCAAYSV